MIAPSQPAVLPIEDAFDDLFAGPLSFCRGQIRPAGGAATAIPGTALMDRQIFDPIIDAYARGFPGGGRRAVISLWSQYYFSALLIPAMAASLALDCRLPLSLEDIGVILDPQTGQPLAFEMHRRCEPCPQADIFTRFEAIVHGHLTPLIRAIRQHAGLSQRLLWENTGGYLAWILTETESTHPELAAKGWPLVRQPTWPGGGRNPLVDAIGTIDEEAGRRRRVCCLRYQLPGFERCEGLCPCRDDPASPDQAAPR